MLEEPGCEWAATLNQVRHAVETDATAGTQQQAARPTDKHRQQQQQVLHPAGAASRQRLQQVLRIRQVCAARCRLLSPAVMLGRGGACIPGGAVSDTPGSSRWWGRRRATVPSRSSRTSSRRRRSTAGASRIRHHAQLQLGLTQSCWLSGAQGLPSELHPARRQMCENRAHNCARPTNLFVARTDQQTA